ncbi:MAG: lipid-A-disaccharide synthase [Rikenellaceae bacterium]|nr:lipid-A-disaccharide synthase [Rikenellaceae bacterium]
MRYYVIAGEASGDLHGANLLAGIKHNDPQAVIRFWGGDRMSAVAGAENMVKHYRESSVMGFWEVVAGARKILKLMSLCRRDIAEFAPDVLILIDYAGFNLRMARFAKKRGIRTYYYIAPKVWAWKESRIKKIQRYVDKLFVIFPFEVDYFTRRGIETYYFGNPVMDAIEERNRVLSTPERFRKDNNLDDRPIVALLAGSRRNEILYNLPFMVEVASHFAEYQFVLAGVPWLKRELYESCMKNSIGNVAYLCDKTYEILSHASAAIVTSGTATLETALLGTPELVCYWCNHISAAIAKVFLKLKWVSLVNIIMRREVVRELLYKDMVVSEAVAELKAIMPGGTKHEAMMADFAELTGAMGEKGASERVAAKMVELLRG